MGTTIGVAVVAPPRRSGWSTAAGLTVAAGLLAAGSAGLLDRAQWRAPTLLFAGLLASTCWALGWRAVRRGELLAAAAAVAAPLLGVKAATWEPPAGLVRASRWRGLPVGRPRRVTVVCPPGFVSSDAAGRPGGFGMPGDALAELVTALSVQLGVRLRPRRFHRQRLVLVERPPDRPEEGEAHPVLARAERSVRELLGATADLAPAFDAAGDLVGFEVAYTPTHRVTLEGFRLRVERTVSAMLPERWRARWDLEGDRIVFERRPQLPQRLDHPIKPVTTENRYRIPYGVDEDGRPVEWALRSTSPHMLVVGATGSGKTVLINGVVTEVCKRAWPVWVIDPKRVEFAGMRDWPNVQIVATTIEDQCAVLYRAWELMEQRYRGIETGEVDEDDLEPLVVVLDEYRDFYGELTAWWAGAKGKGEPPRCPVLEKVSSIARKGRTARVHLILGTQRPDADFLGGEMRDNFRARAALGRLSPQGALMMWDAAHIGVSLPAGIPGRATAASSEGWPVEVQTFWTPDPRKAARANGAGDLALLEALRPATVTHPRLRVAIEAGFGDTSAWTRIQLAKLVPYDPGGDPSAGPAGDTETAEPVAGRRPVEEASSSDARSAGAAIDADLGTEASDELDGYEPAEHSPPDELEPGDLVLVDADTGEWGVVDMTTPDVDNPDCTVVDYRTPDDGAGALMIPSDSTVSRRRPVNA